MVGITSVVQSSGGGMRYMYRPIEEIRVLIQSLLLSAFLKQPLIRRVAKIFERRATFVLSVLVLLIAKALQRRNFLSLPECIFPSFQ